MALIALVADSMKRDRTTFSLNETDTNIIPIDVTVSRAINYENELTTNPVELGPDVTDHIRTKPITMQIEGVISDTPLSLDNQKAGLVSSGASFAARKLGGFKGGFQEAVIGAGAGKLGAKLFQASGNPSEIGRKALEDLILNKTLFRVSTGKKFLDNMVMTRLSIPENQDNTYSLNFSATLQQIRIVKGQSVLIEKIASSAAHTAIKKQNLGAQATTPVTREASKSVLKSITGLFGGR